MFKILTVCILALSLFVGCDPDGITTNNGNSNNNDNGGNSVVVQDELIKDQVFSDYSGFVVINENKPASSEGPMGRSLTDLSVETSNRLYGYSKATNTFEPISFKSKLGKEMIVTSMKKISDDYLYLSLSFDSVFVSDLVFFVDVKTNKFFDVSDYVKDINEMPNDIWAKGKYIIFWHDDGYNRRSIMKLDTSINEVSYVTPKNFLQYSYEQGRIMFITKSGILGYQLKPNNVQLFPLDGGKPYTIPLSDGYSSPELITSLNADSIFTIVEGNKYKKYELNNEGFTASDGSFKYNIPSWKRMITDVELGVDDSVSRNNGGAIINEGKLYLLSIKDNNLNIEEHALSMALGEPVTSKILYAGDYLVYTDNANDLYSYRISTQENQLICHNVRNGWIITGHTVEYAEYINGYSSITKLIDLDTREVTELTKSIPSTAKVEWFYL